MPGEFYSVLFLEKILTIFSCHINTGRRRTEDSGKGRRRTTEDDGMESVGEDLAE